MNTKSRGTKKQRGGNLMKASDRKNLLNKKALASTLGMSQTTLWRVFKINQALARKYKLKSCPVHRSYTSGRKYYLADEVQNWLEYINDFELK